MQFPDFPPPSLLGELSNETREFRSEEIFAIELADVELSTDPVAVFCQIRISNQDGMTRTVTKSWKDLVSFLAKFCRELGASGIPWDTDDLAAAQDEVFQRTLQRSLDSLLENPELLKRPACIDFFHLGSEYQARRNSRAEGPSQPHPQRERVERLLDDVYEPLRQRHARERCDLERRGHSATSSRAAEWHRQEVYLDEDQLARARAASRQHLLGRHVEWLTGPRPLPDEALRDLVHVQHLLDLDLEDLRLPDGAKRSRDRFSGQSGDVSEQMILDATRSVFVIDRKTFCFSTVFEEHGANPDEAQVLKRLFSEALVESVEQCLGRGGQAPPMLLRAVSTAMSQAGLAHVECADPRGQQLVVSGGDQSVRYELQSRADGAWDLEMSVRKSGFRHFIMCCPSGCSAGDGEADAHVGDAPQACGQGSFVSKSCRVRFRALATSPAVEADVLEVSRQTAVLDDRGRPLGAPRRHEAVCSQGPLRALAAVTTRLCALPAGGR
ncbi:unnamed protein product [Prorocentrum cordatum]|uniref:Uncharacterized protein n=1 Tax=Prorocentrum cordatum TaxID=2364126 RepID=A0ABN9Y3D6_9DINO|nr:unnamed protein product [Polarella glacialis]